MEGVIGRRVAASKYFVKKPSRPNKAEDPWENSSDTFAL